MLVSTRYHTWFEGLAFIAITAKTRNLKLPGVKAGDCARSPLACDLDPLMADSDCSIDRPLKYILIVAPHANICKLIVQVGGTLNGDV